MGMRATGVVLIAALAAMPAVASNWYVNKAASGSNGGTSWTNGWNEMDQVDWNAIACGDTVWLAGGEYSTALSGSKSCSAGAVLTFARVLSSDATPTAAAGWSSSYDSQVVLPNIFVAGPASYVTFDGRRAYGIQILIPGTEGDGIDASNSGSSAPPIDHLTWAYIEIYGPACVDSGTCTGGGVVGVQIMPCCSIANRTHLLFDHVSIHRTGEAFRACGWDSSTVQCSLIYDTNNDGQQHEDIQYSNPPYQNVTWRYNQIFLSPNDGIFFEYAGGAVNWAFYGNRVYHSGGEIIVFKQDISGTFGPVFIYNNLFENDGAFGDYQPGWLDFTGPMAAGSAVVDNVFENIDIVGTAPGADYNAYSMTTGVGDNGAHSFAYDAGVLGENPMFVDESPGNPQLADFHLTSIGAATLQGGTPLPSPYNTDPDGTARGSSGPWYIGPYEYVVADAGHRDSGSGVEDGGAVTRASTTPARMEGRRSQTQELPFAYLASSREAADVPRAARPR